MTTKYGSLGFWQNASCKKLKKNKKKLISTKYFWKYRHFCSSGRRNIPCLSYWNWFIVKFGIYPLLPEFSFQTRNWQWYDHVFFWVGSWTDTRHQLHPVARVGLLFWETELCKYCVSFDGLCSIFKQGSTCHFFNAILPRRAQRDAEKHN